MVAVPSVPGVVFDPGPRRMVLPWLEDDAVAHLGELVQLSA